MITQGGHYLGGKKMSPDPRDRRYRLQQRTALVDPPRPPQIDLRDRLPPPFDQGQEGSCGPNSGAGMMCFYFPSDWSVGFSRQQIYWDVRVLEGDTTQDDGVETRDVLKVLSGAGAMSEVAWPYTPQNLFRAPPVNQSRRRLSSYSRLVSEDDFLTCLGEEHPFILGFTCFESIDSDQIARTGIMVMPDVEREKNIGGHDVLVVGYDLHFHDSATFKKSGLDPALVAAEMILIRNSWGTEWGDGGHFWMPMNYATNPSTGGDAWTGRP